MKTLERVKFLTAEMEVETVLWVTDCPTCGVVHALPHSLHLQRMKNGQPIYCPNGHQAGWWETDADRLRKELESLKRNNAWYSNRVTELRHEKEEVERSRAAYKGQLTKVKRRVAAGVCPCCHRTFQDLSRHMAGQHPEYGEEE